MDLVKAIPLAACLVVSLAAAQAADQPPPLESGFTQSDEVRLILVPANVEDRQGRHVRGLGEGDFKLFEDQVPQEIAFVSIENDEPVAIAFLLDVSGSMRQLGKLEAAKQAVRHFVDHLRRGDRFALIAFADDQVAWITEFTDDRERFLQRLEVQEGFGQTALNDAVAAAPMLVFEDDTPMKKAIVLITDGIDNYSRLSIDDAIESARYSRVPIYTVGFSSLPEYAVHKDETVYNLDVLRHFSTETGGRLFVVYDPADLKEAVAEIDDELRYQYLLGYYPSRRVWDGAFREIVVETHQRKHQIRNRRGYYAEPRRPQ